MPKISLDIGSMDCASCAQNISRVLKKQAGIASAEINYANGKAYVEYDEAQINLQKIKDLIVKTGYKVLDDRNGTHMNHSEHEHIDNVGGWQTYKTILALIFTAPLLLRMIWEWVVPGTTFGIGNTHWVEIALAAPVVFLFGWQFHISAFKQLIRGQFNMDSLISLGTLTAFFYSVWAVFADRPMYFESAASIASLILLGKYFEATTKGKASNAMKKLMELGVKKALIIDADGKIIEKNITDVKVGEITLVKPGEKIPLDGIIVDGESDINESMLTGEGLPVSKQIGGAVFGGTINESGQLKIKISETGENTVLAKIIKTVEEAQRFKAPMQKLADTISGIFVPSVMGIAVLTFLGWLIIGHDFTVAIINAVTVLIIACPCALGLATPIAVMVGTSVGAKNGILIKNGESFEKAKKIDTVVFDKTGTLTLGEPKLYEILPAENHSSDEVLKIAAALASASTHPLSRAIAIFASGEQKVCKLNSQEPLDLPIRAGGELPALDRMPTEPACDKNSAILSSPLGVTEYPGRGIGGDIDGQKYFLGSLRIIAENNIDATWAKLVSDQKAEEGGSLIFLASASHVLAAFLLRDELKKTAEEAVWNLKKMGIETIIISGDREAAVNFTASHLAVDNYFAEILPADKQARVKELQSLGKNVVFAGDGINDAPSLVQADLGIAMGAGADIAKEAGNIIIMQNEPLKIVEAIKLARKTFGIIRQNMFWAFFYNVIAIPLAIFGIANPIVAAFAMIMSDITVIGNSLRIYKK